jgi:hypothetical protein
LEVEIMAAPKGNKNAVGNEGGRPLIHTDPQKVDSLIEDYFNWIQGEKEEKVITEEGKEPYTIQVWKRHSEPPTVTGLSLHLGFNSKSTLYDYSEKVEFSNSIKRAILMIEKHHEIQVAMGDKCTGNIFVLKNFGWKDSQSIDHTTKGEAMNQPTWIIQDNSNKDE